MQNKYLSVLKKEYANFGLSKEALDRVALQRVKTITNEEEINTDIASTETMLLLMKELQGSSDALRAKATQTQKELDALKATKQIDNPDDDDTKNNPYTKELSEMKALLTGVISEFAESKKKARTDAILNDVHSKMKALGCTNDYIRTTTLANLEIKDTDTADSIAEKYKSIYDQNCKSAFGDGYVPPKGNNEGGKDEIDFKSMVSALKASGSL